MIILWINYFKKYFLILQFQFFLSFTNLIFFVQLIKTWLGMETITLFMLKNCLNKEQSFYITKNFLLYHLVVF